jgi:arylformamidase
MLSARMSKARIDFGAFDIVLIKTRNSAEFMRKDRFDSGFAAIGRSAAEFLAEFGVKSVGFDCLTIDPVESESKDAHLTLLGHDICVMEGLDLDGVPEGPYLTVCLPLKLTGSDGAPARVVLIQEEIR